MDNLCIAITKKSVRCRNKRKYGYYCGMHIKVFDENVENDNGICAALIKVGYHMRKRCKNKRAEGHNYCNIHKDGNYYRNIFCKHLTELGKKCKYTITDIDSIYCKIHQPCYKMNNMLLLHMDNQRLHFASHLYKQLKNTRPGFMLKHKSIETDRYCQHLCYQVNSNYIFYGPRCYDIVDSIIFFDKENRHQVEKYDYGIKVDNSNNVLSRHLLDDGLTDKKTYIISYKTPRWPFIYEDAVKLITKVWRRYKLFFQKPRLNKIKKIQRWWIQIYYKPGGKASIDLMNKSMQLLENFKLF